VVQDAVTAHVPDLQEPELAAEVEGLFEADRVRATPGLVEEYRVDRHGGHGCAPDGG